MEPHLHLHWHSTLYIVSVVIVAKFMVDTISATWPQLAAARAAHQVI
jgi:hypothetical protein